MGPYTRTMTCLHDYEDPGRACRAARLFLDHDLTSEYSPSIVPVLAFDIEVANTDRGHRYVRLYLVGEFFFLLKVFLQSTDYSKYSHQFSFACSLGS
jgi:hypothetical protein